MINHSLPSAIMTNTTSVTAIGALTSAQLQALTSTTLQTLPPTLPGSFTGSSLKYLNISMNNRKTKIGFIGLGFVGSAIASVYPDDIYSTSIVKMDPAKGFNSSYNDLLNTDGVFVCVPSPQGEDGSADTRILENVLSNLKSIGYKGVIISKVTAPPQVYERLQSEHFNLVHAPEFLTAANAQSDYMSGKFAFIGGAVSAYRNEAERIIKIGLPGLVNVIHCSIAEASIAKYTINCFLATKVTFMNELYKLTEKLGCDYNLIANMISSDERIGKSHMKVPGPDGYCGFGGMCFPKDTSAMLKFAEEVGVDMRVLDAAVRKNTLLRLTEPK